MLLPELLHSLTRALRWHRRGLGIIAAAICLMAVLSVFSPDTPTGPAVLAVRTDLDAGHQLSASDLITRTVPTRYWPAEALTDPAEAVGRTLAVRQGADTILSATALISPATGPTAGAAEVLVPFRIADTAVAGLLQVGDTISVVGTSVEGLTRELASRVRVAGLPTTGSAGGLIDSSSGAVIVVATSRQVGTELAAAAAELRLGVVIG